MKVHITAIFDKNHLSRAIACRVSLYEHSPGSIVRWLCLDDQCYEMARKIGLRDTIPMRPKDLGDTELLDVRKTRTNPEFASTCKPAFLRYMMRSGAVDKDDLLVFIDPDFYFYQPALPFFKKVFDSGSIAVTPHRFPPHRDQEKFKKGILNAGIVCFKNDAEAMRCLDEWRKQCLDWCYLRYENGQIGDQGYLSEWPKKYKGVYKIPDKGVNLSTWNIENYKITREPDGNFLIDSDPLICYHFHGLKFYLDQRRRLHPYPITVFHKQIYKPCIVAIQEASDKLLAFDPNWTYGTAHKLDFMRLIKQKISEFIR